MDFEQAKSVMINLAAEKQAADLYVEAVKAIEAEQALVAGYSKVTESLANSIKEKEKAILDLDLDYAKKKEDLDNLMEDKLAEEAQKLEKAKAAHDLAMLEATGALDKALAEVHAAQDKLKGLQAQIDLNTKKAQDLEDKVAQVEAKRAKLAESLM